MHLSNDIPDGDVSGCVKLHTILKIEGVYKKKLKKQLIASFQDYAHLRSFEVQN